MPACRAQATGNARVLDAAAAFVGGLNAHARVPGGYAVVRSVATMQLEDVQPSYFLAETCKYLFLIADPGFLEAREHEHFLLRLSWRPFLHASGCAFRVNARSLRCTHMAVH